jgi:hypothetical protein
MVRADEAVYPTGLPGVPRLILWVKFSACGGVLNQRGYALIKSKCTAPNRAVYASGAVAPSGYEKPQSACGLCAVFLRHIFAVAGNLRFPLTQPPKRHIQPERYAPFFLTFFRNFQEIY